MRPAGISFNAGTGVENAASPTTSKIERSRELASDPTSQPKTPKRLIEVVEGDAGKNINNWAAIKAFIEEAAKSLEKSENTTQAFEDLAEIKALVETVQGVDDAAAANKAVDPKDATTAIDKVTVAKDHSDAKQVDNLIIGTTAVTVNEELGQNEHMDKCQETDSITLNNEDEELDNTMSLIAMRPKPGERSASFDPQEVYPPSSCVFVAK
jgi:hypothetical protein